MATYSFRIYDIGAGDTEWPAYRAAEVEASSAGEAVAYVRGTLEAEAAHCVPYDGYDPGDKICAVIWDEADNEVGIIEATIP